MPGGGGKSALHHLHARHLPLGALRHDRADDDADQAQEEAQRKTRAAGAAFLFHHALAQKAQRDGDGQADAKNDQYNDGIFSRVIEFHGFLLVVEW